MYLKKEYFLIALALLVINSCSTTNQKEITPISVTIETPNCPTSKCRIRYSTSSKIYDVTPSVPVIVTPVNADLYVACYEDESEGKFESIVVPGMGYRRIIHPLDCSYETSKVKVSDSTQNEYGRSQTTTEREIRLTSQPEAQAGEEIESQAGEEIESQAGEEIESLDQSGSDKDDNNIQIVEDNLVGGTKENQEELDKKEKLAKELMDQIDSLYKQGLITKEIYEKEKLIILNITN